MTVKEFLEPIEQDVRIVLMNKEGKKEICQCGNRSEGIIPYLDRSIVAWRVSEVIRIMDDIAIIVTLEGENE